MREKERERERKEIRKEKEEKRNEFVSWFFHFFPSSTRTKNLENVQQEGDKRHTVSLILFLSLFHPLLVWEGIKEEEKEKKGGLEPTGEE